MENKIYVNRNKASLNPLRIGIGKIRRYEILVEMLFLNLETIMFRSRERRSPLTNRKVGINIRDSEI